MSPRPIGATSLDKIDRKRSVDPVNLRQSLLALILKVGALMGLVVYVPSVIVPLREGQYAIVVIDTISVCLVLALYRFDRLAYRWRASAVCVICYALAVGLLVTVGSISQIYLVGFSIVTVLLFGLRAGVVAAALSSLSLFAIGAVGHAAPQFHITGFANPLSEWFVICINFALVDTLVTLAVGTVLAAVNSALESSLASAISLDQERKLLRTLIDALPDVVFTKDVRGAFVNCNPATLALLGVDREDQMQGKTVFEFFPAELAKPYFDDDMAVMAGAPVLNREERSLDSSGAPIWYLTTKVPLRDAAAQVVGLIGISRDITQRKQAEADRARLLAELQLQIEQMPLAYLLTDRDLHYKRWNPAAERLFGYIQEEVLGKDAFASSVAPGSAASSISVLERIKAGTFDTHVETEHQAKDGRIVACEWHNTPMFDEDGSFAGLLALGEDVTARKRLEGQLRQAQKMEAIGQLAGGVAHDFNNLLTVVLSYSDLILEDSGLDEALRDDIEEIRRAGLRAADLTRQLLMFSRQQVMQPKVFDLNELMSGMGKMLRRLLGEDIELTAAPGASHGRVRADPGSVEQVLVNLVVNARDAMPVGGKLRMETANIELDADFAKTHLGAKPGAYVSLAVTDTGVGMDKPTLARIFEPFFTTKEKGKGTGLGLSTVFGIVQQSGGTVWVYSEPGLGTTFKVYLPQVDIDTDGPAANPSKSMPGGTETILLVEDEDAVRSVACSILRRAGYTVLEARNAEEALAISQRKDGIIHLLLTDIVMPGMSGPELAKRLAPLRPYMKVLCMSGYTDDAAVRHGFVDAGFAFVQKPLTIATLTQAARDALDSGVR